jgi:mannose-1-phosphate guanylyltransferase
MQLTYDRFKGVCDADNVWVVTSADYVSKVREQLPEIPAGNILSEPCRRNTAPCIAYVSHRIKAKDPKASIVVTPSDHVVVNVQEFQRVIGGALQFASETDAIVTLGMKPTRPETGYGYIQADMAEQSLRNSEIFRVESFREKPDLQTAQQYIQQNNYYWNAGIFVWNVNTIINAFRIYQPGISAIFESLTDAYGTEREQQLIDEKYAECENISVDYAIMEKAEEIFVFPADFGWSDLGTWGSLHTLSNKDAAGNALISKNVKTFETSNCVINVEDGKQVVVQGLDGYIVAQRDGRLLICKLSEEQRIKEFSK